MDGKPIGDIDGVHYYDRGGNRVTFREWAKNNREVTSTHLLNGYWVSTIFIGIDHAWGNGPPMIFESMVFTSDKDMRSVDMMRYSTEVDARIGHELLCQKWSKREISAAHRDSDDE